MVRGAYDLSGKWWFEEDIETFTGGMIRMCFGKERERIKIIEIKRIDIKLRKSNYENSEATI